MVHALREAHRVITPNGVVVEMRPAAIHRRVAVEHAIACPHDDIVACPKFQAVVRERIEGAPLREIPTDSSGTPPPLRQNCPCA